MTQQKNIKAAKMMQNDRAIYITTNGTYFALIQSKTKEQNMKTVYATILSFTILTGCAFEVSNESPTGSLTVIIDPRIEIDPSTGSRVGNRAPNFTLPDLNGQQVTLNTLNSNPVYINFCDPNNPFSQTEMTKIDSLHKAMNEWITVVGICSNTTPASMRNFVEQNGYTWIFLLDSENTIKNIYKFTATPANIFINKYGIITARSANPLRLKDMDRLAKRAIGVNN